LEREIEKLLKEIEKSEPGAKDPLGVAVPWEKKYGEKSKNTDAHSPKSAMMRKAKKGKKKS
jgi:hypothetical protein